MSAAGRHPLSPAQGAPLRTLWLGLLCVVGIYGVTCLITLGPSGDGASDRVRQEFSAIAVALGGGSMLWRRRFLRGDAPPLSRATVHTVVIWSLSATVAVVGACLAFGTRTFPEFVPFGCAAAALLLLHRPSRLPLDGMSEP